MVKCVYLKVLHRLNLHRYTHIAALCGAKKIVSKPRRASTQGVTLSDDSMNGSAAAQVSRVNVKHSGRYRSTCVHAAKSTIPRVDEFG